MKKISVIIPVYNTEKFIKKCLNSILGESVEKEIIIINDGSTDNSLKIISDMALEHKEIIVIDQENHGQGYARNVGINKAQGKYLCFIDSDDYINPGSLDKAIEIAEKDKKDILYWNIDWIYENNDIKHQPIFSKVYDKVDDIGYLLSDPSPCNKLFRKDLFKKNNLEFPTDCIYEDFALIPSLVKYTKNIGYTNEITYNYLQRNSSTMNQVKYNPKMMNIIVAYNHLYNALYPEYKEELEYIAINQLIYFRTFELLKYNRHKEIKECLEEVNKKFPDWKHNKYFVKRNKLIKIYCLLISKKQYILCKFISFIRKKLRK